jgi:nicotinic acid mononucleotide adenylyltransferase
MDCFPEKITKKKAVFTFGRFQPPTIGHAIIVKHIEEKIASGEYDGYICVSKSKNIVPVKTTRKGDERQKYVKFTKQVRTLESVKENRNPLSADTRIKFLKLMYPTTPIKFINGDTCKSNFQDIHKKLKEMGYEELVLVIGSDRMDSFSEYNLQMWIEKVGETRTTVNTGTIDSISATIMRNAAIRSDFDTFKRGTKIGAMTDSDVKELMDVVRLGMGFETPLRNVRVFPKKSPNYIWPKQIKQTRKKRKNKYRSV